MKRTDCVSHGLFLYKSWVLEAGEGGSRGGGGGRGGVMEGRTLPMLWGEEQGTGPTPPTQLQRDAHLRGQGGMIFVGVICMHMRDEPMNECEDNMVLGANYFLMCSPYPAPGS